MFGAFFGRRSKRELSGAEAAREFLERSGSEGRTAPVPAWALLLRSPFRASEPVTSWLGGVPRAPENFGWPLDRDGEPLSFLAQINLADVKREPESGLRPQGLPERGALLIFVGQSYACHILSEDELAREQAAQPAEKIAEHPKARLLRRRADIRRLARGIDGVHGLGRRATRTASLTCLQNPPAGSSTGASPHSRPMSRSTA